MLTFAEEILLLLLDDESGDLEPIEPYVLDTLLAGAVLMDLAIRDRVDSDLEHLFVADSSPTGEAILDPTLAAIGAAGEAKSAQDWVTNISANGDAIRRSALDRLVERGILEVIDDKFLWLFRRRRYPMIDDKEEREVKLRLMDILLSEAIPDPRDVALICLADAGRVFQVILSKRQHDHAKDRIAQVRKLDLIGQAMSAAIRKLLDDIAAAMVHMPH